MAGHALRKSNGQFAGSTKGFGAGRSRPGVGGGRQVAARGITRTRIKAQKAARAYNNKQVGTEAVGYGYSKGGYRYNVYGVTRAQRRTRIAVSAATGGSGPVHNAAMRKVRARQRPNQIVLQRGLTKSQARKQQVVKTSNRSARIISSSGRALRKGAIKATPFAIAGAITVSEMRRAGVKVTPSGVYSNVHHAYRSAQWKQAAGVR